MKRSNCETSCELLSGNDVPGIQQFRRLLLSECVPHWHEPRIHCVILSFYTATTMDRFLLRLTPHLAEARGGQAPLVADAFNATCP